MPQNTLDKDEYLSDVPYRYIEETRQMLNDATSRSLDNVIEDDDGDEMFVSCVFLMKRKGI